MDFSKERLDQAKAQALELQRFHQDMDFSKERLEQAKTQALELENFRQGLQNDIALQAIEARIVEASVDTYLKYAKDSETCEKRWENQPKPGAAGSREEQKQKFINNCMARLREGKSEQEKDFDEVEEEQIDEYNNEVARVYRNRFYLGIGIIAASLIGYYIWKKKSA